MANTTVASELRVKKFLSEFFQEYIRKSRFSAYTGTSSNNVITIKQDRKQIEIPLVTRLKGDGVSGSSTLRGNGESIGNYGLTLTPTYYRHAVEFDKEEMEKPAIDLMRAARPLLMDWAKELTRDHIIDALNAVYDGTTYSTYGAATAGAHDTWLTNNADRVLYGSTATFTAGDHTTSLDGVGTGETLSASVVELAKRIAQNADPHIRPIKTRDDDEMFVLFADPYAFRDLRADTTMANANRDARERGVNNPLFKGGDLLYDNVLIREVPEFGAMVDAAAGNWGAGATADGLNTAGTGSTRVGYCALVGQQAVSFGLGQRPNIIVDREYDYGFQPGVAVECKHDIDKSYFNSVQHGVVSMFVAAAAD